MKPIKAGEDHMTFEEFVADVQCGGFDDYDGYGYYATDTHRSDIVIRPSDLAALAARDPKWTHVVWYNR